MKHMNLAILASLVALAACAGGCPGERPRAKTALCKGNLRQIYVACTHYRDEHGTLPFAGEGARAHEHLQLLVNDGIVDDPKVFVCLASKSEKPAEVDANGNFKLSENTCSYAYMKIPVKSIASAKTLPLLLADKHMVHGGINTVTVFGSVKHVKTWDGATWEELTNGELTR